MKKVLAFMLAMGLLLSGMTVCAEEERTVPGYSPEYGGAVDVKGNGTITFIGNEKPDMSNEKNIPPMEMFQEADSLSIYWQNTDTNIWYWWNDTAWVLYDFDSESDSTSKSKRMTREERDEIENRMREFEAERRAHEQASRESVRLEAEADREGFENAAQMQSAQAANKSAGEYYNNAVTSTMGIENATPVAQGGGLIVDGKTTNMTASISKVSAAYVDSVTAVTDKFILNVVDVQFPAATATVNFYMPGVTEGEAVTAMQYAGGMWTEVEVVEVREDHVVLNLDGSGVVAFMK